MFLGTTHRFSTVLLIEFRCRTMSSIMTLIMNNSRQTKTQQDHPCLLSGNILRKKPICPVHYFPLKQRVLYMLGQSRSQLILSVHKFPLSISEHKNQTHTNDAAISAYPRRIPPYAGLLPRDRNLLSANTAAGAVGRARSPAITGLI